MLCLLHAVCTQQCRPSRHACCQRAAVGNTLALDSATVMLCCMNPICIRQAPALQESVAGGPDITNFAHAYPDVTTLAVFLYLSAFPTYTRQACQAKQESTLLDAVLLLRKTGPVSKYGVRAQSWTIMLC